MCVFAHAFAFVLLSSSSRWAGKDTYTAKVERTASLSRKHVTWWASFGARGQRWTSSNTYATCLHEPWKLRCRYGFFRNANFDAEKPTTVAFCQMGSLANNSALWTGGVQTCRWAHLRIFGERCLQKMVKKWTIFKRLRATAGQGPNYVGPFCGYVGLCWLCWSILRAMWAHLVAMLAYVAKRSEKWEQQKKLCKTQDILMVGGLSWGYVTPLDAMLAYLEGNVGPSWGYVGPSWGYVGPSWSYVGPCWGYVGPSWGLCCPMLRLCWPILRPMLAHVGPSWAIRSEKWQKMGRAQNTVKRGTFWWYAVVGGRGRGPSLLRRGENCRTARTRPGGPWPDLWGLRLTAGRRQKQTRQPEPGLNSTPAAYILGEVAPTAA